MYGITTDPPHPMVSASNLASKEMEIALSWVIYLVGQHGVK